MRIRSTINDFGTIECERPRILWIDSVFRHQNPEPANLRIRNRPERIERETVLLHPPIEDVMRAYRMLHGEQRRDLIVSKDDFSLWVDDETHVEEPILPVAMMRLGLSYHKGVVFARDST